MVYVDELQWWPTPIRCFQAGSCHLTADDIDELHAFARRLGLKRAWFQPRSSPHYDLTPKRRERALELGAVFVPAREQARKRLAARGVKLPIAERGAAHEEGPRRDDDPRQGVAAEGAPVAQCDGQGDRPGAGGTRAPDAHPDSASAPQPSTIEWRRRTGGHRRAHLFVAGVQQCGWASMDGSPFRAVGADEISSFGVPFGKSCEACLAAWRRRPERGAAA